MQEMSEDLKKYISSQDFMKIGQAVTHNQWVAASMAVQRLIDGARKLELKGFERPLAGLKQAVLRKNVAEAKQTLAQVMVKRVDMYKQLFEPIRVSNESDC